MKKIIAIGLLTLGLLFASAGRGRAATLDLAVPKAQGATGEEVEIPITVKGAVDLGALELVLYYDAKVLEAVDVTKGPLVPGEPILEFNTKTPGEVKVVLGTLEYIKGDGVLLKARFRVVGQTGQQSALNLNQLGAWDGRTQLAMLVNAQAGTFEVLGAPLPWLWIAVGGGACVLLLLVLLAFRGRSRSAPAPVGAVAAPAAVAYARLPQPAGVAAPVAAAPANGTFKHVCGNCRGTLRLPAAFLGKQFACGGCGSVQVGGQ